MNEKKVNSKFNVKSFFCKFIFILIMIQVINNLLIFFSLDMLFHNPRIPQYRLIGAVSQIITFFIFIISVKPSAKDLGIYWPDIKKSTKNLYVVGGSLVLLLVISSYFIMKDMKYFALATNIQFGITTPILEEVIFRGYGWHKFKEEKFSNFMTLIITSISFGLFHVGYYYQIAYATQFHPEAPPMVKIMLTKVIFGTVLGLLMGLIRWKSKKVFGPIIIHSILNIISR